MRFKRNRTVALAALSAVLLTAACASSDGGTTTTGASATTAGGSATTAGGSATTAGASATTAAGGSAESGYDWTDVRVRQAISMAIDRKAITDSIFLGSRAPADDWIPPSIKGYRGGDFCANLQYNPDAAKKLWDEAGGDKGPITLWFNSGAGHEEWMEAVANQLKANLGVKEVKFQGLEFADLLDKLDADQVNGPFRSGWIMDYPSPGNFLGPLYTKDGSTNNAGYNNPKFDEAVAAGDAKPLEESIADYQKADDILCNDVPVAPMFFGRVNGVWSNNVKNVAFDPFQHLRLSELEDVDGDGEVSHYICEPQNGLFGQMTNESCGSDVVHALFTGLASLSDDGVITYDGVAESIETSDGGTSWTIKLKDGWTFHDGTKVTSESFADAWNWAALGSNGATNQYFLSLLGIKGFKAMNPPKPEGSSTTAATTAPKDVPTKLEGLATPDDLTITLSLEKPFPQLPLVLLYDAFNPLPKAFFDDPKAFGEKPIGNGPFKIDGTWEHDVQVKTVAYDAYKGNKPKVSAVTYKIYSSDETGYNDVRSDALDIIRAVPTAELGNFKTEFDGRFVEQATSSFNYLGFPINQN